MLEYLGPRYVQPTEEIMHRQTLVNKRNMLRRGLNATESCAEHSGTFNRRREGIEVEGKIPNVRTHENVRRIVFKYIFVFLVHINRQKEFGLYSLIHSFAGIQYINAKSSEVAMAPFQHFATDEGLAIQRVEPRMTSREDDFCYKLCVARIK